MKTDSLSKIIKYFIKICNQYHFSMRWQFPFEPSVGLQPHEGSLSIYFYIGDTIIVRFDYDENENEWSHVVNWGGCGYKEMADKILNDLAEI